MAIRAGLAVLLALALAARAHAQGDPPRRVVRANPDGTLIPNTSVREADLPLMFTLPQAPEPASAQRSAPPLPPADAARLRHAQDLRMAGLPERALDTLRVLDRDHPHHALIVTELARAHSARDDWNAVFALLQHERALERDSLLGARELELACERLQRPREAAQVAVEAWSAWTAEGEWAMPLLLKLAASDARAPREVLKAALAQRPWRGDLARGLALLAARAGEPAEAARVLAAVDEPGMRPSLRSWFAEEAMSSGLSRDSVAAIATMVSLVGDTRYPAEARAGAARRAWSLAGAAPRGELALALEKACAVPPAVPPARFGAELQIGMARELRASGHTAEARALLAASAPGTAQSPEFALESALAVLREGPPARAVPLLDSLAAIWTGAAFMQAEARFFAAQFDSALAGYLRIAAEPEGPQASAALERAYLLEESPGAPELPAIATLAWERWRGAPARAGQIADSLARTLPRDSHYTAHVALEQADLREQAGDWGGALAPLAMVADSLAGDRLAPLARQREGEALLALGEPRQALAQFEECLARYPRAWNAAEVRRRVEKLRRDSRP